MKGKENPISLEEFKKEKLKGKDKLAQTNPEDLNPDDLSNEDLEKILFVGDDLLESDPDKKEHE